MNQLMQELWGSSHLSAGHAAYLENLYETYLTNPENLSKEWRDFFANLPRGSSTNGDVSHQSIINEFTKRTQNNINIIDIKFPIVLFKYEFSTQFFW